MPDSGENERVVDPGRTEQNHTESLEATMALTRELLARSRVRLDDISHRLAPDETEAPFHSASTAADGQ